MKRMRVVFLLAALMHILVFKFVQGKTFLVETKSESAKHVDPSHVSKHIESSNVAKHVDPSHALKNMGPSHMTFNLGNSVDPSLEVVDYDSLSDGYDDDDDDIVEEEYEELTLRGRHI